MSPRFSIIIPVYKVEAYLRKCLDSVLGQSCADWECICVDDGSPDGCGAILDEYVEKVRSGNDEKVEIMNYELGMKDGNSAIPHSSFLIPHFKVIHQKNAGVSAARNVALDVATGEWVQFLDADDSLEFDFLEKLSAAINQYPDVDAVEHTAIYCYDDGHRVYGDQGRLPPKRVVCAEEVLRDPMGKRLTYLRRCACYKIFRRSVIEQNGLRFLTGVPVGEDTIFASCFYAYADKIALCPDIAGYLRIFRQGSALQTLSAESLIPQLRADEMLYETWLRHPALGFDVTVCASIVSHFSLGKDQGKMTRDKCVEAVLSSGFYRGRGMRFLLMHGTRKARLFAFLMLVLPRVVKRKMLKAL